jgi:hypothetical protein
LNSSHHAAKLVWSWLRSLLLSCPNFFVSLTEMA